ncbi:hypothetical protein [Streptomyces sp. NPDC002573]|uniref:hypothetical protein n=1 Tax=Streptomyces sp. NPDC002573 TaxID=3364651 RepID=UPI00367E2D4C
MRVSRGHVSDNDYEEAATVLTEEQISAVAWVATAMNAFNRRLSRLPGAGRPVPGGPAAQHPG